VRVSSGDEWQHLQKLENTNLARECSNTLNRTFRVLLVILFFLMENHISHVTTDSVTYAKDDGLVIL
jgi:hypothetical protein